jgi:hypothetical protein
VIGRTTLQELGLQEPQSLYKLCPRSTQQAFYSLCEQETPMVNLTNLTTSTMANATAPIVSQGPSFVDGIGLTFSRFWDLISAPFAHSHMQWIIFPLLLTFILTEFYFFRHTDEELGWNAALVNSLVLVFIAIDLTKTVFENKTPLEVLSLFGQSLTTGEYFSMFLVITFIGGLGFALAIINYFHLLPRKFAYLLSSHPPINFIAYFAIVQVYSEKAGDPVPLDMYTVIAATLLFTLVALAIFAVQRMIGTKDPRTYSRF